MFYCMKPQWSLCWTGQRSAVEDVKPRDPPSLVYLVWCHFGIIQVCNSLHLRSYLLLNQLVADLSWTLHAVMQPWLSLLIYILYYPLSVSQSEDYQHCEHLNDLSYLIQLIWLISDQSYRIHQLFLFGKSIFFWVKLDKSFNHIKVIC